MDNLGVNSINALPSEIIILEAAQVAKIGQKLTESRRLNDLRQEEINALRQDNKALSERLAKTEFELSGKDGSIIASYDEALAKLNQRLAKLEHPAKEPGQTSQDRAARIDHYMAARPDHKASYEALKGFLEIDDVKLNLAVAALMKGHPGKYARQKDKNDGRKKWLTIIPKIA